VAWSPSVPHGLVVGSKIGVGGLVVGPQGSSSGRMEGVVPPCRAHYLSRACHGTLQLTGLRPALENTCLFGWHRCRPKNGSGPVKVQDRARQRPPLWTALA
jgi:hypothetical protein